MQANHKLSSRQEFELNPVPKPKHERRVSKREYQGKFLPEVREEIIERDNGLCIRCQRPANHIHHITYRSQQGKGTKSNGCCVCYHCHTYAHSFKEGRQWFEKWREVHLDENGNLKQPTDD